MAKTIAQVGTRALQKLGVVEGDGSEDSNDTTLIAAIYDSVYQWIREHHLASWGSTDSIPEGAVEPVAALLAKKGLTYWTPTQDRMLVIMEEAKAAPMELAALLEGDYISEPVPIESF